MKKFILIRKNLAFTLAEMLVVMTVIAVVAMLSIPTVVLTNRDKAFSDMLIKEYQNIEKAFFLEKLFNLDVSEYDISFVDRPYRPETLFIMLSKKLKTIKICGEMELGCFGENELKGFKMRLVSGAGILVNDDFRGEVDPTDETSRIFGSTYIDVDGPIGVNKAGVDQFGFYMTRKGLIPMGGPQDRLVPFSNCLTDGGFSCTAWVLINKNMNYKKCPNVINWETKKTCN